MTSFYTNVSRYGNKILWRGYENGRRFSKKIDYKPSLFFSPAKNETEYKSLLGERPVERKIFESMNDAKDFAERYKEVHGIGVFGNTNFVTQFIQEKYPGTINFDMDQINIFSFDIEVDVSEKYPDMEKADNEITSIAIKSSTSDTYHLLSRKDYDKTQTLSGIDPDDIQFMKFDDEISLLLRFIQIWKGNFPDIVTGWNVEYFDIAYVITRIIRLLGEGKANELSPWGRIKRVTSEIFNRIQYTYDISGITVIDYMDAFKKFGYKYGTQESYKLDHIAHVVLGTNKLKYDKLNNMIDTHRFITDGAKDVVIPADTPDEELSKGERAVKQRDIILKEIQRRGLSV